MNVARTIRTLEDSGPVGCHIEDQVNPKWCGHLDSKSVAPAEEMVRGLWRCPRHDPDFAVRQGECEAFRAAGEARHRGRAAGDPRPAGVGHNHHGIHKGPCR
jgi:hypothetical protein